MAIVYYPHQQVSSQLERIFSAMGCNAAHARLCAHILVLAELRGIPSHGLMRVKEYHRMWKKQRINASPNISVVHETPGTAVLDADRAFGVIAGVRAMEMALDKASHCGTAWIAVNNSTHYGIAAYYAMMALEKDMIGISMTNANTLVAPTFSKQPMLGTNPIAVAVPAGKEPPFIADFATAPIARGKISIMEREKQTVPPGLLQDSEGQMTTDPSAIKTGGCIRPLGGDYEQGSHKGYAMAAIVDILSAVLPGANFGPFVPPQIANMPQAKKYPGKGLGHFFGVMRIDAFSKKQAFKDYMDLWIKTFKNTKATKEHKEVLVHGEPERRKEKYHKEKGIPIPEKIKDELKSVEKDLNIPHHSF